MAEGDEAGVGKKIAEEVIEYLEGKEYLCTCPNCQSLIYKDKPKLTPEERKKRFEAFKNKINQIIEDENFEEKVKQFFPEIFTISDEELNRRFRV